MQNYTGLNHHLIDPMTRIASLSLGLALLGAGAAGLAQAQVFDLPTLRQQSLAAHNQLRQLHSAPALVIDEKLNIMAQRWAEQLAKKDIVEHSPDTSVGENIYAAWGSGNPFDVHGKTAVQAWYDEIKLYKFAKPGFSMETGHFTQVVWKNTVSLGCGKARSTTGKVYVVCNYEPQGNFLNQFQDNVAPAK